MILLATAPVIVRGIARAGVPLLEEDGIRPVLRAFRRRTSDAHDPIVRRVRRRFQDIRDLYRRRKVRILDALKYSLRLILLAGLGEGFGRLTVGDRRTRPSQAKRKQNFSSHLTSSDVWGPKFMSGRGVV